MKVSELISRLEECDPEAEVRVMCQPNYPFENAIDGVVRRDDFSSEECDCDRIGLQPHEEGCPAEDEEQTYEDGLSGDDVFILEGRQERYGSRRAWD
jgi:hypothetical protein